jgi:uncharacterized protein (TIGR03437 family)
VAVNHHLSPVLFVSPGQINLQTPALPVSGNVDVQVIANCDAPNQSISNAQSVSVQTSSPEFFFFTHNVNGPSPVAAIDSLTGLPVGAPGSVPGVTLTAAKPGELISLYATGLGLTAPPFMPGALPGQAALTVAPVSVLLNGVPLDPSDILYAGDAPGFAGLYQINIRIPANTPNGDVAVSLMVNGISAPVDAILTVGK